MASTKAKSVLLPAIIDLDALDAIRDELIDVIEQGAVSVSAKAVERVCTNGLLMLISAAQTARSNSFDFEITETSTPMLAAIDRLGLGESFAPMIKE